MKDIYGQECTALTADYQPSDFVSDLKERLLSGADHASLSERAAVIAHIAHEGQKRQSDGQPYTTHLEYVAAGPDFDEETKAVAWLHDSLEKTRLSANDLLWLGIPEDVVEDVKYLSTKDSMERHFDDIERLLLRERCRKVKIRDIEHNSSDRLTFAAQIREKAEHNNRYYNRLFARNRLWYFSYPLTKAFLETADKYKSWRKKTIIDFMQSAHCPEEFRAFERIRYMTSHPLPEAA